MVDGSRRRLLLSLPAQPRTPFYTRRMADWANTIPFTIASLRRLPHPLSRFGVLGLSPGAMPALTASAPPLVRHDPSGRRRHVRRPV